MPQSPTLRVAIVDDDELYRDYLSLLLAQFGDLELVCASSGDELFELMRSEPLDCILLDYDLGSENGLSVIHKLKSHCSSPPPVVLLTGDVKQNTAIRAFRIGVSDYLLKKDLTASELLRVIRDTVGRTAQVRRHEEGYERLLRQSPFDASTGLYGRGFIEERTGQLCARQASMGLQFALVLIDFAEWPEISAKFGSVVGDRALKAFAARLKNATRKSDICGRYEGATFAYLIDLEVRRDAVDQIQARLIPELSSAIHLDELSLRASAKIGTAICPEDGRTFEALFAAARSSLAADPGTLSPAMEGVQQPETGPSAAGFDDALLSGDTLLAGHARTEPASVVSRSTDRRGAQRHKALKRGTILLDGAGSQIECQIRDLSEFGARLSVNDYFAAPDQFSLRISGVGQLRRVRRCWQIKAAVGVEFL